MSDIILELSLRRSSGVLAGIVASLAQAGIELKTQKLQRGTDGRGGWLTITGEGEAPAPWTLAERLSETRGVEKLMRMSVDGEVVLAEGKSIEDQIQPDDLVELSAGSDAAASLPAENADTNTFDEPASTPDPAPDRSSLQAPVHAVPTDDTAPAETGNRRNQPETDETYPDQHVSGPNEDDHALASAISADADRTGDEPAIPEFAADPTAEDDLADALSSGDSGPLADPEDPPSADTEGGTEGHVGATLRRRRRRRR